MIMYLLYLILSLTLPTCPQDGTANIYWDAEQCGDSGSTSFVSIGYHQNDSYHVTFTIDETGKFVYYGE